MTTDLFTPLKSGSLQLANRIVMAPLTRGRAGVTRVPNDFMREYYELRSSAGLIVSEATAISKQGYGWYGAPGMYTDEQCMAWKPIVDAVHSRGGKFFLQLWHMGRKSHPSFHETDEIIAPSPIAIEDGYCHDVNRVHVPHAVPREILIEEIPFIVGEYKRAAEFAKQAGFDGVEIHAANGYLIDQFLQSVSNHRTDQYGGSFQNRFRFLKEVLETVGTVFPFDRIGVRLSPNGSFAGMGSEDNYEMFSFVARELSSLGLAYLHLMDGVWRGFHNKCDRVTCFDMKRHFGGLIIANSAYTKEIAEGVLRSGAADLVSFGTPFLANPDLVERFKNNWPLEPAPPVELWFGWKEDPALCLEGYLNYRPFQSQGRR
jgi:N-ethylmaleimide reductase